MNNSSNKVYVSDNFINFLPARESFLFDVNINISHNGVLTIEGYEKEYSIAFDKININNLNKSVEREYIKHYPGFKLFGIQFAKPYDYVYGWFVYKQKHFKTIIMNEFVFEII